MAISILQSSGCERSFKVPMITVATIDRLVDYGVIFQLIISSYGLQEARWSRGDRDEPAVHIVGAVQMILPDCEPGSGEASPVFDNPDSCGFGVPISLRTLLQVPCFLRSLPPSEIVNRMMDFCATGFLKILRMHR